jgi:hypothetical protein
LARQVRREFVAPVNEFGDIMRVRMNRDHNMVVDFVVQFEALIDESFLPVVRYDGSHGVPHRDLLDWSGKTIDKHWAAEGTTMGDALTEAIRDIRSNWEYYREAFLRRRP